MLSCKATDIQDGGRLNVLIKIHHEIQYRGFGGVVVRPLGYEFRVLSPVRFILMWTRTQPWCEKSTVNALLKVMDFFPVLRSPPVDWVG